MPKSVGINMRLAAALKRKPAHCLRVTCASSLFNASVASKLIYNRTGQSITMSGEVEKVSGKVYKDTMPVCFVDFKWPQLPRVSCSSVAEHLD